MHWLFLYLATVGNCDEVRYGTCGDIRGEQLIEFLKETGANAVMVSPKNPRWVEAEKNKDFVALAHQNGIHVSTYQGSRGFVHWNKERTALNYPYCYSGQYRAGYGTVIREIAACGFDTVSVAPEEFVWNKAHGPYEFGAHSAKMRDGLLEYLGPDKYPYSPSFAEELRKKYKVPVVQDEANPDFLYFMLARYESVTDAIKYWRDCAREINPQCETTLLLANYLCSDRRYDIGAAWDLIGSQTGVDRLGTDPYVILHNYRGDVDHWYATETAKHLIGANKHRKGDTVLQITRLRKYHRPLRPVEMYGCALSSLAHGLRRVYYFNHAMLMGVKPYCDTPADPGKSRECLKNTFSILKDVSPWVERSHVPRKIAVLYSRAGEDLYQLLLNQGESDLLHQSRSYGYRYSFLANWAVLNALFREGYPFELYYLDQLSYEEIKDFKLLVLPFPLAIPKEKAGILKKAVKNGSHLLVISEYGAVDEFAHRDRSPALLKLLGLKSVSRNEAHRPLRFRKDSPVLPDEGFAGATFSIYTDVELRKGARWLAETPEGQGAGIVLNAAKGRGKTVFLAGEFGIRSPISPVLFCYAGDFDKRKGCTVTDSPWEKIAIFEKDGASVESSLSLSPLVKEYKMYIVYRGAKEAKETDSLVVTLNDETIQELPLKPGWKTPEFAFKPKKAESQNLKITLRGTAGAAAHKMFFTPVRTPEEKAISPTLSERRYLAVLLASIDYLLGEEKPLALQRTGTQDVEATILENEGGVVLFVINWEDTPVKVSVGLNLPTGRYTIEQRNLRGIERFSQQGKGVFSVKDLKDLALDLVPQGIRVLHIQRER